MANAVSDPGEGGGVVPDVAMDVLGFAGFAAAKVKILKMMEICRIRSAGCNKRCEKKEMGNKNPVGKLSAMIKNAASESSNKEAE